MNRKELKNDTFEILICIFLLICFVNYPSWLTNGCNVCGLISTLPLGTLEMSVTAHTRPRLGSSGATSSIDGVGVGVSVASEQCAGSMPAPHTKCRCGVIWWAGDGNWHTGIPSVVSIYCGSVA